MIEEPQAIRFVCDSCGKKALVLDKNLDEATKVVEDEGWGMLDDETMLCNDCNTDPMPPNSIYASHYIFNMNGECRNK